MRVRIPGWCDPACVRVSVEGQDRRALVEGRFLCIGWLKPGDQVSLTMPVPERTIHRVIGEIPYKLTLRGSNVVDIDPPGIAYPLYQDQPTGDLVKKTLFRSDKNQILW